jgi:hypothetical protein
MGMPGFVIERQQLRGTRAVAGFFKDFANYRLTGGLANVGPSSWQRPEAIIALSDQQDRLMAKYSASDVDFGGGVTDLAGKEMLHVLQVYLCMGRHNFGGYLT